MLILMNIKNKLKCENNYLIRDQNNFSFIAEIAGPGFMSLNPETTDKCSS